MQDLSEIFSRTIRAARIRQAPERHEVTANPAQCAALARVFGLPGIAALRGDFSLQHEQNGVIAAALHLQARLTQTCVVTLEPFETLLDDNAALRFVPAQKLREGADLVELDAETLEGPDEIPYSGELIDLGAALAEQLALSLDPYPRKPGAELPAGLGEADANPFSVLAFRGKSSG